jgi:hypothetical protein
MCPQCALGKTCSQNTDCQSGKCNGGHCASATGLTLSFSQPINTPVSGSLRAIDTSDFDGDGKTDVVTVEQQTLTVRLGHGDGTLGSPMSVGGPFNDVKVGDLNNDHRPDLLAEFGGFLVLLNNGNGTFQSLTIPGNPPPGDYALGDIDGDGLLDFAALSSLASCMVYLNLGGGTFGAPTATTMTGAANAQYFAVGDLNGDGKADVAIPDYVQSVVVLLATGGGVVSARRAYMAGTVPAGITIGDFNADKVPDIVVTDIGAAVGLSTLLGDGSGGFRAAISQADNQAGLIVSADFDRDGFLDVLSEFSGTAGQVIAVSRGRGDGTFFTPLQLRDGQYSIQLFAVGDFNGDGKPDIVAAGNSNMPPPGDMGLDTNAIAVFLNTSQ